MTDYNFILKYLDMPDVDEPLPTFANVDKMIEDMEFILHGKQRKD